MFDLSHLASQIQQANGSTGSGEASLGDAQALQKALTAGYGTDSATLEGGAALRVQSLDMKMKTTIQDNSHFALFNMLQKTSATATVDEWTEQASIGGTLGGSTNSETGPIRTSTGDYNRRVGMVKYLMTQRQVSLVQSIQNTQVDSISAEESNGALELLTDAEFLCFEGDSAVVPTQFDGIISQLRSLDSADHILDAEGQSLASVDLITKASSTIAGFGNFGRPSHIFWNQDVQADFDLNLDPAWRVNLSNDTNGSTKIGTPVTGIRTSQGHIATQQDVFLRDQRMQLPYQLRGRDYARKSAGLAYLNPTSVAVATASQTDSKFALAHAGMYYYLVAGVNMAGESTGVLSTQVAVGQGDGVTLTINRSASQDESGYVIYRSRRNGTSNLDDLREMTKIPASPSGVTTYTDLNREIPGTSKAFVLNMTPGADAITWRQLMPMLKFNLYPTNSAVIPWAQMLFGYLRLAKRQQHVMINNIVPSNSTWKPFS